jgi:hypothetical protein
LSSICTGPVASGWLSKWGTTTGCKTSLLGCLVWWLNSACSHERYTLKQIMSLHRKGQLAGGYLGYRLYFCVSKPYSGRRLHEAETSCRLTNESYAMSLNSNHVVLNTMPSVFVDVSLPTVDFNDSPWLTSRWLETVSNCSCWQTSIGQPVLFEYGTGCKWHPSNQTLQCSVVTIRCYPWSIGSWQVFRIVGLRVLSPVGWLQYSGSPSDVQ